MECLKSIKINDEDLINWKPNNNLTIEETPKACHLPENYIIEATLYHPYSPLKSHFKTIVDRVNQRVRVDVIRDFFSSGGKIDETTILDFPTSRLFHSTKKSICLKYRLLLS